MGVSPEAREGWLKPEYAEFYPGLEPGVWQPVGVLLQRIAALVARDPSKSGVITGERTLRDDRFEFRGASDRPEGWPGSLSRLSDAGAGPGSAAPTPRRHDPPA